MWVEFILPLIWVLGVTFSMDEMTMDFKIHHAEKISITYKYEVYGLQTDTLFQKGYLYQIFMCKYPISKK